jgi:hypothetical protein
MTKFVGKKNSLLEYKCPMQQIKGANWVYSLFKVKGEFKSTCPLHKALKNLGCIVWSYVWETMNWKQSIVIFETWIECPWTQQGGVTWLYNFHFSIGICWCHKGWAHFCRCRKWLLYVHHIANWKHIVLQQYPSKNIQTTNHTSIKTFKYEMWMDFCMK